MNPKRSWPFPFERGVAALLFLAASVSPAQQSLTWDQVKSKFEAANPALKADALGVDEMRAEEITAYLRPNPQFTTTVDGTQIAPNNGHLAAAAGNVRRAQASVTCMSATTNASCASRAQRKARGSPPRSMRT